LAREKQVNVRVVPTTLVTAAIRLWNTVYLERATNALRANGQAFDPALRQHLSPLSWEHINLTGDYLWRNTKKIGRQVQAFAVALTYDMIRFLRGPYLTSHPDR
jgi:hypothetical protein